MRKAGESRQPLLGDYGVRTLLCSALLWVPSLCPVAGDCSVQHVTKLKFVIPSQLPLPKATESDFSSFV